eukprot:scaffold1928_cov109-Alexandrium_tamarense.AAC.60
MDDNDMPAVRANLKKARKCWTMFSRLLTGENMSPRVCEMFYRAVIQLVLLFGSESWVLTDTAMRVLEGFHVRSDGKGTQTQKEQLHRRMEYIEVRRQTIANYIVHRPIFDLCLGEERQRGTSKRLWWFGEGNG